VNATRRRKLPSSGPSLISSPSDCESHVEMLRAYPYRFAPSMNLKSTTLSIGDDLVEPNVVEVIDEIRGLAASESNQKGFGTGRGRFHLQLSDLESVPGVRGVGSGALEIRGRARGAAGARVERKDCPI